MRVLPRAARLEGHRLDLVAGLLWAIEEGFDVIELSLSTTRTQILDALHEIADGPTSAAR